MRAGRLLRGEPEHPWTQRREHARHGRPRLALRVRADERIVVHRVEVGGHPLDGLFVPMAARVDLPRVADAEPEQEAVVERVRQHARGVRGGTASRPQMFAIPEATRMRSVAPRSTAPFVNDSRVPSPSGYQSVS